MATERGAIKRSKEQFEKSIAGTWGLLNCAQDKECGFCQKVGDGPVLGQYRNLYVAGIPNDIIPALLGQADRDITPEDMEAHAFRQNWRRHRGKVKQVQLTEELITTLALRRFADTQKFASPNSADKMIDAMMKIKGIGKEVTVSGQIGLSWEQVVTKNRANKDMVITVPDDDIVELAEDVLLEGPDA